MATGSIPDPVLLEDLRDIADFLEHSGKTVHRDIWASECVEARQIREQEARDAALENGY